MEGDPSVYSFDISNLFATIANFYRATNTDYYISPSLTVDGLHLASVEQYRNVTFNTYQPSSPDDVATVFESFSTGIFKSFFCSLCSSERIDQVSQIYPVPASVPPSEIAVPERNPSNVRTELVINNIHMVISGTSPVYLQNQLIMYPKEHIATYLMLLSYPHFDAIYTILSNTPNATAIFNGNYGSDIFHGHIHLTDFDFDLKKNILSIAIPSDTDKGTIGYQKGVVSALVLYNRYIDDLHTELVNYLTSYLLNPRSGKFFTGTLFVGEAANGVTFYYFAIQILNISAKEPIIVGGTRRFNLLGPSQTLIVNTQVEADDKNAIKDIISRRKVWEDIPYIRSLKTDYMTLDDTKMVIDNQMNRILQLNDVSSVEAIQWKVMNFVERIRGNVLTEFSGRDICITANNRNFNLSECQNNLADCYRNRNFGSYKFIISLFVVCRLLGFQERLGDRGNLEEALHLLFADEGFLQMSFLNQVYDLYSTYKVDKLPAVKLHTTRQTERIIRAFADFIRVTGNNPKISAKDKNKSIKTWLMYNFNRIGDTSVFGKVTKSRIRSIGYLPSNLELIIKAVVYNRSYSHILARHENRVGFVINELRKRSPNFMATYGFIECYSRVQNTITNGKEDIIVPDICSPQEEFDPNNTEPRRVLPQRENIRNPLIISTASLEDIPNTLPFSESPGNTIPINELQRRMVNRRRERIRRARANQPRGQADQVPERDFPDIETKLLGYQFIELIEGRSLQSYIESWSLPTISYEGINLPVEASLLLLLAQLFLALGWAYEKVGLVHGDGHAGNIMVKSAAPPKRYITYTIGGNDYSVYTAATPVLIDYGLSHVNDIADPPVLTESSSHGTNRTEPTKDTFAVLMYVLWKIYAALGPNLLRNNLLMNYYALVSQRFAPVLRIPLPNLIREAAVANASSNQFASMMANNNLAGPPNNPNLFMMVTPATDLGVSYRPLEAYLDIRRQFLNYQGLNLGLFFLPPQYNGVNVDECKVSDDSYSCYLPEEMQVRDTAMRNFQNLKTRLS